MQVNNNEWIVVQQLWQRFLQFRLYAGCWVRKLIETVLTRDNVHCSGLACRCWAAESLNSKQNISYVLSDFGMWRALIVHTKEMENAPFAMPQNRVNTPSIHFYQQKNYECASRSHRNLWHRGKLMKQQTLRHRCHLCFPFALFTHRASSCSKTDAFGIVKGWFTNTGKSIFLFSVPLGQQCFTRLSCLQASNTYSIHGLKRENLRLSNVCIL